MGRPSLSDHSSMASADVFATLDRVVGKYRRDVHQMLPGATPDALLSLEAHLSAPMPRGLREFLVRYNGAQLFRGSLRLRSTSEIAPASDQSDRVALFADGHNGICWAFAPTEQGHVFGRWEDGRLHAMHSTFRGWLDASLEILDARVQRPHDQAALRLEADPRDPYQLFRAGVAALEGGRPEEAEPLLARATRAAPDHVEAWQRLGDALAVRDRGASKRAWLRALHQARLPLPWPGAPTVDVDLFASLARTYTESEPWEHELERFVKDRVTEIRSGNEFELLVAASSAWGASLARRGRRRRAREVLADLVNRSALYAYREVPWAAALDLARLEIDLANHDAAERLLRRIRTAAPERWHAAAAVQLGRIAVMREEPWAEDILADAIELASDPDQQLEASLLRVERAIRQDRLEDARTWLTRARPLTDAGVSRRLRAWAMVLNADLHRLDGDVAEARSTYAGAAELLGPRRSPELQLRIALRQGDITLASGHRQAAEAVYRDVVVGYRQQELPLREAWALVRLSRVAADRPELLEHARTLFREADLAAGVAVVDALLGDPAASLGWHLERAKAHAQARYDAQRSKPPFVRADAEGPERRLGAHRMAIASCSDAVVDALQTEMQAASRAIHAGRARPLDPPVMTWVAAVDLLAGHRSFNAAKVLLKHLRDELVGGDARRALRGALSRSRNAALVDGLLSCVENPDRHPATAVAASAEVLGLRREHAALQPLMRLIEVGSNPLARKASVVALGRIGERRAADRLAPTLDEPALAEAAALALLMLGDRRGIDFHARALSERGRKLSGHPGELVGRYGGPSHLLVLIPAATAADDDIALGALQGLGLMGDPRAIPVLLKALDPRRPRRAQVAAGALEILTGHLEDADSPGAHRRWQSWWEDHERSYPAGVRHRRGRLFDPGGLIAQMDDSDAYVRRTAYDELVITAGAHLPFDSDGPWRAQRAHLKAWRGWWATNRSRLPSGRWWLDGHPLD